MLRSQQYETRNASLDEIGERYDRCIMLAPYTHFPRNVRLSHLIGVGKHRHRLLMI